MADSDEGENESLRSGQVSLFVVLGSMAAFWAAYFVLATVRSYLIGLDFQSEMMVRRLFVTVASIGVTLLLWLLLRAFDERRMALRLAVALGAALPGAVLIALINREAFLDIETKAMARLGEEQGIEIRSDDAGNLLVDVPDFPEPPAPPGPEGEAIDTTGLPPEIGDAIRKAPDDGGPMVIDRSMQKNMLWLQLTDTALGRFFLLLAWSALYFAMTQAEKARLAERREGEYRRAAKAAELKSLRYQVNPHFLFNTLNSLSALVMTGRTAEAEEMIQTISTFYRRSLAGDPTDDVALSEEIELQRLYLDIEGVRFPERLRTEIVIPPALASARIPGMILQPLVENSVKYAVASVSRPVTLRLDAREEHGRLVLTVSDDGPGAGESEPGKSFGIGLANVRQRLAARFGDEASVVSGDTGQGWRTVIRMPLNRPGARDEDG